jgi:DNA polymerase III subunit delta'
VVAPFVSLDGALPLPWLAAPLKHALQEMRGHATLLHGAAGAGLFELAMTLAQGWLCEARGNRAQPCGSCASCHLARAGTHPDLLVLVPDAMRERLGWGADSDEEPADGEGGAKARAKPSREIKVEAVRHAIGFAQQSSARGQGKAIVIHPADTMNLVSANALLKTLEEPPGTLRLVLTTASAQALLPTLRSRCHALRLDAPGSDAAVAWLREQGVAEPEAMLAAMGGQPLTVLDWLADGGDARDWARLPALVAKQGDPGPLTGWPLPRAIDALVKLCHDAMALAAGGAPRFYPATALPAGASLPALVEWSKALAHASRYDEHPWNASLLIESLVTQGRRAWQNTSLHSAP